MVKSLFFRFTILGDEFNPKDAAEKVALPCYVFVKGETHPFRIPKLICGPQKTNRWVYHDQTSGEVSVRGFLTKNLVLLNKHMAELSPFLQKHSAKLEYIIYAGNKTDITLSRKQISLINRIGVTLSISFC